MNYLLAMFAGVLPACITIWFLRNPLSRTPRGGVGGNGSVFLNHSRAALYIFVVICLAAWLGYAARIAVERDTVEALSFTGLVVVMSLVGAWCIGTLLRNFHFSKDGITARIPVFGYAVPWSDVTKISSHAEGIPHLRFRINGRRDIVVGADMHGFLLLLKQLPDLATGEARDQAIAAIAELKRNRPTLNGGKSAQD